MAVAITGSSTVQVSLGSGTNSQAFTIPSDADAVLIMSGGFFSTGTHLHVFDALNWDNGGTVDFTSIVILNATFYDLHAYVMTSTDGNWPGTGAKTLSWSMDRTAVEGGAITIVAVKGLDKTTPTRSTDSNNMFGSPRSWTASLSGVISGDLSFIAGAEFVAYGTTWSQGTGQTQLQQRTDSEVRWTIGYEAGESAPSLTAVSYAGDYSSGIAFALAEAAAAAAIAAEQLIVSQAVNRASTY